MCQTKYNPKMDLRANNTLNVAVCLMRSISSRFRGFGFIELLSEVGGLGGIGTIESALKDGDVKFGIRFYKLLFKHCL